MSDTSTWYARRVAQLRGTQPLAPRAPIAPAPAATQRALSDIPYRGMPTQTAPTELPPTGPDRFPGAVTIENFAHAMGYWKGGKGQQEKEPCPNCGHTLWSRTTGIRRGPPPAPLCYNCGYNGMFEQGLESSWSSP